MTTTVSATGVVRGTSIELDRPSGLPDGTRVEVAIQQKQTALPPGEGLRRAFGAWADDPEGVDRFLEQVRSDRDNDPRPESPL